MKLLGTVSRTMSKRGLKSTSLYSYSGPPCYLQ
nr:MAG TPA: hypothetical protein [Caudoviricetes sp.]